MLVTLAAARPAHAIEFVDTGPLRIRDQFLLNMSLLAFEPDAAPLLKPGQNRVEFIGTVSNTFAMSTSVSDMLERRGTRKPLTQAGFQALPGNLFYLDAEVYRSAVAFDRALGENLQIGVTFQWLNFSGGTLDGFIEGFHDTFGLGQSGRKGVPRDTYTLYVRSNGTEVFRDGAPESGLGDIVLRAKSKLTATPRHAIISLQTAIKVPRGDGNGVFSSGSPDLGVELLGSYYPSNSLCLHYSLGVLRLGQWPLFQTPAQTLFSGMLGQEVGTSPSSAIIAQMTVSQSPFADLDLPELGTTSFQVSLGYKQQFDNRLVLFGAVTENVAHFDNTADIGFHIGVSRAF